MCNIGQIMTSRPVEGAVVKCDKCYYKVRQLTCTGINMNCSDIWHKYQSVISKLLYMYVISQAVRRVKFETILKYHKWYLCHISRPNHAIICLYYYPQKVCNFHMQVFQTKLKYHCSKPIKLQKFLIQQYNITKCYVILLQTATIMQSATDPYGS